MTCPRHPGVEAHGEHCAACLLEVALAAPRACLESDTLTILVPLGSTDETSVFVAREATPEGRLIRLKTWRVAAPPDLLARVIDLQARLEMLALPTTPAALGAGLDSRGCLFVLSEFRQGIPVTAPAVASTLTSDGLRRYAQTCTETLAALHGAGLVHGAMHGGNVLVHPATGGVTLLDTGMHSVLAGGRGASADEDRRALDRLILSLGASHPSGRL